MIMENEGKYFALMRLPKAGCSGLSSGTQYLV